MYGWLRSSALALGLLTAAAPAPGQEVAVARVAGRVVAVESGRPVAGALVRLAELNRSERTDVDGAFAFEGVLAGVYTVEVEGVGYKRHAQKVTVGAETVSFEVSLSAAPVELAALPVQADRMRLVGDAAAVARLPGSAAYVDRERLDTPKQITDDVHSMLRQVPGLNIQEEDGYGLRPNIGMRGTGSERSSKITLMEDGVLISPAPYAAPAAYYFPVAGRMEAVEVRKGSSQIKYGPRTTGGALNLVSSSIPEELSWTADIAGGSEETGKLRARVGDSGNHYGWMAETYQIRTDGFKRIDGGGESGFDVSDYLMKVRLNTDRSARVYQEVQLKLGRYDQLSNETYLGLTGADFDISPLRRYAASQRDEMDAGQRQYQLRHVIRPARWLDMTTVAYVNEFDRKWYKLQSVNGKSLGAVVESPEQHAAELAILQGGASAAGALVVRANNRSYYARGIQSIFGTQFGARLRHELELGIRYHEDEEDRFQHQDAYQMTSGRMTLTSAGAPGTQDNRVGSAEAWAIFAEHRLSSGRWSVTPGVRYESIEFVRKDYAKGDAARQVTTAVRENDATAFIPGIGATYALTGAVSLFGGVHKGFGPPGPGADEQTQPEESVNYEAGARYYAGGVRTQLTGYFNDYRNILGKATLAVGESGADDLFNGGAVQVKGLEFSGEYEAGRRLSLPVEVPLRVAYTYTEAEFQTSFDSDFEPWGNVEAGDELPYIAKHQLHATAGVRRGGAAFHVAANYIGAMRTRAGQGQTSEGLRTDASLVLDASAEYGVGPWGTVYIAAQNLADSHYVVARAPAGARPGLPRTFLAGVKLSR